MSARSTGVLDNTDCDDADAVRIQMYFGTPTLMGILRDAAMSYTCSRNASTDVLNNTDYDDGDAAEYPCCLVY